MKGKGSKKTRCGPAEDTLTKAKARIETVARQACYGESSPEGLGAVTATVLRREDGFDLVVSRMYEHCAVSYSLLKELGDLWDTESIDVNDTGSHEGCDTCDFGSSYEVTFNVRHPKRGVEWRA